MRKTKSDIIAEFKEQFLATKPESYRTKFEEKNESQQYSAINHWKKSVMDLGEATKDLAQVSAANVISHLKEAQKKLVKLEDLTPKETQKIHVLLDSVKDSVANFDKIKKQNMIKSLLNEKAKLAKKGEEIDKEIQSLQEQL